MANSPAAQPASPTIKIYTASWCAFCQAEKKFLNAHHIAYAELDVEADEAAGRELARLSGQMGIPFTVITQLDGSKSTVLGFDQAALKAALGLKA